MYFEEYVMWAIPIKEVYERKYIRRYIYISNKINEKNQRGTGAVRDLYSELDNIFQSRQLKFGLNLLK